jgi:hypothetical protein
MKHFVKRWLIVLQIIVNSKKMNSGINYFVVSTASFINSSASATALLLSIYIGSKANLFVQFRLSFPYFTPFGSFYSITQISSTLITHFNPIHFFINSEWKKFICLGVFN